MLERFRGTARVPVVVHSSKVLTEEERLRLTSRGAKVIVKEGRDLNAARAEVRQAILRALPV